MVSGHRSENGNEATSEFQAVEQARVSGLGLLCVFRAATEAADFIGQSALRRAEALRDAANGRRREALARQLPALGARVALMTLARHAERLGHGIPSRGILKSSLFHFLIDGSRRD